MWLVNLCWCYVLSPSILRVFAVSNLHSILGILGHSIDSIGNSFYSTLVVYPGIIGIHTGIYYIVQLSSVSSLLHVISDPRGSYGSTK